MTSMCKRNLLGVPPSDTERTSPKMQRRIEPTKERKFQKKAMMETILKRKRRRLANGNPPIRNWLKNAPSFNFNYLDFHDSWFMIVAKLLYIMLYCICMNMVVELELRFNFNPASVVGIMIHHESRIMTMVVTCCTLQTVNQLRTKLRWRSMAFGGSPRAKLCRMVSDVICSRTRSILD